MNEQVAREYAEHRTQESASLADAVERFVSEAFSFGLIRGKAPLPGTDTDCWADYFSRRMGNVATRPEWMGAIRTALEAGHHAGLIVTNIRRR